MKKIILLILLMAVNAFADGAFVSIKGESGRVTVTYTAADRDSTWVVFYAPASGTAYDSVKCIPIYTSTRFFEGIGLALDSLGLHRFVAKGFANDAWADTITGTWLNLGAINAEAGSGFATYPCTLYVGETSDSTAIGGVSVTMRPIAGGDPFVQRNTTLNGLLFYSSEAESIGIYLFKPGVNPNAVDTLVIVGAQTDSLWMTIFVPDPGPATMTNVFTWITAPNGDTLYPTYLSYQLVDSSGNNYKTSDKITYGTGANTVLLTTGEMEITADSSLVSFSLYANENLNDVNSKYRFRAKYKYQNRPYITTVFTVAIPDTSSINPFGI